MRILLSGSHFTWANKAGPPSFFNMAMRPPDYSGNKWLFTKPLCGSQLVGFVAIYIRTKDRLNVIMAHQKPISLINFLRVPKRTLSLCLSSLNYCLSCLQRPTIILLIDVATQWTDRHFIDLSLTKCCQSFGRETEQKINDTLQWENKDIFFS